ncbi:MAG: hypothetical protein NZ941_08410 [Candidatus Caldarchaeum sp.]|nr:hypothetical protein [Candidatus Caldarchaeum sp.]
MKMFFTEKGYAEQFVPNAQYMICDHQSESVVAYGYLWRRSVFLYGTPFTLYFREGKVSVEDTVSVAIQQIKSIPITPVLLNPTQDYTIVALPNPTEEMIWKALEYGALAFGFEYFTDKDEAVMVALFREHTDEGDRFASDYMLPLDFIDHRWYWTKGNLEAEDVSRVVNDSDLMPQSVLMAHSRDGWVMWTVGQRNMWR